MAEATIQIDFEGYWRDENVSCAPATSGVCRSTPPYNASANTLALNRLLYVGEAADVRARLERHERRPDWKANLRLGEQLCFPVGRVESSCRDSAEAALIYMLMPPLNTSCTDQFNF